MSEALSLDVSTTENEIMKKLRPFQGGTSVVVPYCSCCLCLYFGSSIMSVTYFVNFR